MEIVDPFLRAFVAVTAVVVLVRLVGLRSLSKMSSVDFVTTVAIGSVLASAVTKPGVVTSVASLAALFALIWISSIARRHSDLFARLVDNEPILLMVDGKMIEENLSRANVTTSDVYAKLREANALNLKQVRAVVMECTGDVSVLHGNPDTQISPELLEGLRI